MTTQPESVWLAITGDEGTPLAIFTDPESAFDYYEVETFLDSGAGVFAACGAGPDYYGTTWAHPRMTLDQIASVFGEDVGEVRPVRDEPRWMIHLWDPISETHERVILCVMPLISKEARRG